MAATPRFGFRTRVFFHDFAINDFAVSATGPHCLKPSPFARAALARSPIEIMLVNLLIGQSDRLQACLLGTSRNFAAPKNFIAIGA
jgi:hypothetical protein